MKIINNPLRQDWKELTRRPELDTISLHGMVGEILSEIKKQGNSAVRKYVAKFQGVELDDFAVTREEFEEAEQQVAPELKAAILKAKENIEHFHAAQKFGGVKVETTPGVVC